MTDGYYPARATAFTLFTSRDNPAWRRPQFGALAAVAGHWSLASSDPALVSLPTGTGKTAVALAAPFLAEARRTLVVVPSMDLRHQICEAFETQGQLVRIGAMTGASRPAVVEVGKRISSWATLVAADVVVALPNSISPVHYAANPPPVDLFDLVIIDEGHHAPAPTWRAILEYFPDAKRLLLTATPYRRDGQRLPGRSVYNYPLRQAIDDGVVKPVGAVVLMPASTTSRDVLDGQIIDRVMAVLSEPAHGNSTLLIRAAMRSRAESLASLYRARGLRIQVLHSGVGSNARASIVQNLRNGSLQAVAVVGMLGEGFDLPSLRVLAYHDKYKSLAATAQLLGRLARTDPAYPQPSVVVTVRDVDVYPELQGAVRALYDEDPDWATVLPGIIDEEVAEDAANRAYVQGLQSAPPVLSLEALQPIKRSVIREVPIGTMPSTFANGHVPDELTEGRVIRGWSVLYASVDVLGQTIILVTSSVAHPKWHDDPGLDSVAYGLHLISIRQPPRADLPTLLLVNSDDNYLIREVMRILELEDIATDPDPARLNEAFDSIERESVSSIGVRTTYAGRGTASYRMFVGSGVDRGLRDSDTAFSSLGHAMIQASDADGSFTAGIATGKGKYWETRHTYLRDYMQFATDLAERYWFPPASATGQLLPQVTRGKRLASWPNVEPLAAEFDFGLLGTGWHTLGGTSLDRLDLQPLRPNALTQQIPLEVVEYITTGPRVVWRGYQDLAGRVHAVGADIFVQHGLGTVVELSELLTDRPPTIFFINGTTVLGGIEYDSRAGTRNLPADLFDVRPWPGVDLGAETRDTATRRGIGRSIHEALELILAGEPRRGKHRWVISNDGPGEIADYIVVEVGNGRPHVGLWHAKFAHGSTAAVRISDLEEVTAQAIKSRRWITEVGFWKELGARLHGRARPSATLIEGNARQLDVLCGEVARWHSVSFPVRRPLVIGHIGVAQPGLSRSEFDAQLALPTPPQSALQARELLSVLSDSVATVAGLHLCCSA